MHIYIDNGTTPMSELDLPTDFWPELTRTNPFLTEVGSQSIPFTLPASENNLRIMGFNYRTTLKKRPAKKIEAIFSEGSTWLRGTLFIETVNEEEGISCTFYTDEGQLYEKIKDYKLADLDWPVIDGVGADMTSKVKWWLKKFETIMTTEDTSADYFIFGVNTSSPFFLDKASKLDYYLLLNETNGTSPLTFLANEKRVYYNEASENATTLSVPIGYGVTPFLKLSYMIRHIIECFGYVLDINRFDTDVSMRRLVLLNNTADAIVNGKLSYKQLLPDNTTVEDFINFVRTKFGIELIQRGNHIQITSWEDVLKRSADNDLSAYIVDAPSFSIEDKKALSLTFELIGVQERMRLFDFFQSEKEMTHLSPSGYAEEKIDIQDKTPCYENGHSGYMSDNYAYGVIRARFLHVDGVKNPNSEIIVSGSTKKIENENEEIGIVCGFSLPGKQIDDSANPDYEYYSGTIFSLDTTAKEWGTLSLVASTSYRAENPDDKWALLDNLYNKCYLLRDDMLKKANQLLEYKAVIPTHLITTMRIDLPKIIQGQKVLIERIDYVVGHPDLCQITARTLHQYPDQT